MSINQRITEIINVMFESNKRAFSTHIGVSPAVIENIVGKRQSNPSFEITNKILLSFDNLDANWLITGRGEMLKSNSEVISSNTTNQLSISQFRQKGYAPFYSDMPVSAGQYGLVNIEQREKPESWIKYPGVEADGWFPVIGCSMEPKIHAGDIVGVKQLDRWERIDPDKVYMIITHDDRMIKHIETDDNDNTILWAISTNFKRFKIDKTDIIRIYRIVWVGRPV